MFWRLQNIRSCSWVFVVLLFHISWTHHLCLVSSWQMLWCVSWAVRQDCKDIWSKPCYHFHLYIWYWWPYKLIEHVGGSKDSTVFVTVGIVL